MTNSFGYQPKKNILNLTEAYKLFYGTSGLIKESVYPKKLFLKYKESNQKIIENNLNLFLSTLKEMVSEIEDLNKNYGMNIKIPNLEHILNKEIPVKEE
jgi:hypothetical protein